jgi:hypothetical protein
MRENRDTHNLRRSRIEAEQDWDTHKLRRSCIEAEHFSYSSPEAPFVPWLPAGAGGEIVEPTTYGGGSRNRAADAVNYADIDLALDPGASHYRHLDGTHYR